MNKRIESFQINGQRKIADQGPLDPQHESKNFKFIIYNFDSVDLVDMDPQFYLASYILNYLIYSDYFFIFYSSRLPYYTKIFFKNGLPPNEFKKYLNLQLFLNIN